jgi:hypothetical protein
VIEAAVDMGPSQSLEPPHWHRVGTDPMRPVSHLSVGNPHAVVWSTTSPWSTCCRLGEMVPTSTLESSRPARTARHHDARPRARCGHHAACGTGACARRGRTSWGWSRRRREITVHMDGGDAKVRLHQPSRRARAPWSVQQSSSVNHRSRLDSNRQVQQGSYVDAIQRSTRRNADRAHQARADRLVGVTLPGSTDGDTDASLDELALLIDTAGADEAGRLVQRRDIPDHTGSSARARSTS